MNSSNKRTYAAIGIGRLLDIEVFLDDEKIYEGRIENAPEDIKKLKYSDIKLENTVKYYVYSDLN